MRTIERQMNAAIRERRDWASANTRVEYEQGNCLSRVYLHGNKIAEVGDGFIRLFDGDHPTKTTKSRLNAILEAHGEDGDCVFQSDWKWFVQMRTVQGLSVIPFFSSMRLG